MTSTNFDQNPSVTPSSDFHSSTANPLDKPYSPESSFSDAYNEDAELADLKNGESTQIDDDDYAMTFDSDEDESTFRNDIRGIKENIDTDSQSCPSNVPATNSSIVSKLPQSGEQNHPLHLSHAYLDQNSNSMGINPDKANTSHPAVEPPALKPQNFDDFTSGGIDIQQLLDNITANAEKPDSPHLKNHNLPIHTSLPPRPNISQNNIYTDEGPKYYAGSSGLPPASTSYRPPGAVSSLVAAGAPGTSTDPRSGLPPPPTVSFRGQILNNPSSHPPYSAVNRSSAQEVSNNADSDEGDDLETKWGPEIQKMYDEFLEDERRYVTEGLWDRFPMGSRLFIGNLPSEKVTKRDLFHVFYHYGKIAQISIKQAYGFVQFLHSDHCYKALDSEQGAEVRGRKMHLEISKPQKNTRNTQHNTQSAVHKLKSPDRMPGNRNNRNNDRFDRQVPIIRNDEYGRQVRSRDDYRPVRSTTPPRGLTRVRDAYTSNSRDPYDTRDRRRSRSPYGHRDTARYRERSLSPRVREGMDDIDLPIPHRDHRDVPDVQIILMEQLDRQFVCWVEKELRSRGLKTDVMILSPRVSMEVVIRRQIMEGVLAVSRLDVISQNISKIPLQVFDRQGGANNVRFDEYQDLDPKIAGELVMRAKLNQTPSQPSTYHQASFVNPAYEISAVAAVPNLANLVGSLDNATLQKLLGTLNIPTQQQNLPLADHAAPTPAIDLASFLGGLKQNSVSQNFVPPSSAEQYNNNIHTTFRENNPQSVINQSQSQPAQQVQNIMAQLARYRQ